jgi:hypothetical protein
VPLPLRDRPLLEHAGGDLADALSRVRLLEVANTEDEVSALPIDIDPVSYRDAQINITHLEESLKRYSAVRQCELLLVLHSTSNKEAAMLRGRVVI